jgi:hypothetical protein
LGDDWLLERKAVLGEEELKKRMEKYNKIALIKLVERMKEHTEFDI